ncbi:DUF3891 family protein [Barrientosiimonas marina]|uniref:DUF3891 family protein n=1 Tax=Lentibacillus kimchii TaxID=1542911 RepID=A0ABW2UUX4_9BACI
MIVRERDQGFVMIQQHHHAQISGELARQLDNAFFDDKNLRPSVEYAIAKHDDAWKMLDKQPFWNDLKQEPYRFTDVPNAAKTVFYKQGIDTVQEQDDYAALICSEHYRRFLENDPDEDSQQFVEQERQRQQSLMQHLDAYDQDLYWMHWDLLQFLDSLSLYVCMNEPGAREENRHPFFKNGITVSPSLSFFDTHKTPIHWQDNQTVVMDAFPFAEPVTVTVQQKIIPKQTLAEKGLIESYRQADFENVSIQLTGS